MAVTLQNIILTQPEEGGDTVDIAVGALTITMPLSELFTVYEQGCSVEFLLHEMVRTVREANVNPLAMTLLELKTLLESRQYLWGV